MSGFSATDLGIVSPRLAALKRRGRALKAPPLARPSQVPSSIKPHDVVRLTRNVANGDAARTLLPAPSPVAAPGVRRRDATHADTAAGARAHERRWRNAPIIVVERRRGVIYQYGSIALCAALWAQVFWMFRI